MSSDSGTMLLEQITPRLKSTIPKSVLKVGGSRKGELPH